MDIENGVPMNNQPVFLSIFFLVDDSCTRYGYLLCTVTVQNQDKY